MHRPIARLFAVCATLVLAAACEDDTKRPNPGDGDGDGNSIVIYNLALTVVEDTPTSGLVAVTDAQGAVHFAVQTQAAHGTLAFTDAGTFTYTPEANYAGADSIEVTASDDLNTVSATVAITVTPVNDPPTLAATPTLTMLEDGALTLSAGDIALADVDNPTGGLSFTVESSANYLSAGNEVRPLPDFNGNLTVKLMITDGIATAPADVLLVVEAVNDAPGVTVPEPQSTEQDTAFTFESPTLLSVSDRDAGSSPLAVTLSASSGTLTLSGTDNLTFTVGDGSGDTSMAFTGTLSAINAALNGLVVTPNGGFSGLITLTLAASDQGATGSGGALSDSETFTLGVDGADLPPFNTLPDAATTDEDAVLTFQGGLGISVADPDAATSATVTVALTAVNGTVTLSQTTGLGFATGDGTADPTMSFSGTFVNVNAALTDLTFTPTANFAGVATLAALTTSNGLTDNDSCSITVAAVNDAPEITGPASAINVAAGTVVPFTGPNALTVTDIDSGAQPITVTATASTGAFTFASPPASSLDTSVDHRVVLTGPVASLLADLALLQLDPQGFVGTINLSFVVNDQGHTGSGGERTDTVNVTINESAALGANTDSYKVQGNVPRVVAAPGVLANDAGTGLTVTTTTTTSARGGTVTMQANGAFTYTPPIGEGAREQDGGLPDSFTYAIQDQGGATATGTVNLNIRRVIWFVDKDGAGATQDGTFLFPFDTIDEAVAAAEDSHFGTWIYVRKSATEYTTDFTLPEGTSLFGSRADFDLQDADSDDPLDPFEPTTLPGLGSPLVRPVNVTAMRHGPNSKISGFDIRPGASSTGPAIAGVSLNSGVIDHVTIDDFATAIALVDTGSDSMQIDNVHITDATTAAITLTTGKASGLFLTESLIERVGRGLDITSSAGADDNGRLIIRIAATDMSAVSQVAVSIVSTPGSAANEESSIRIAASDFINTVASGVVGTNAIVIDATRGDLELGIDDVELGGFTRGVGLTIGTANVNAVFRDVELNPAVAASFSDNGLRIEGGAGGRLDLTASQLIANVLAANAVAIVGGATSMCLDLFGSTAFGDPTDLVLTQTGAPIDLEGWNSSDPLETYFQSSPRGAVPRDYQGSVSSSGTITAAVTCAEPPTF